MNPSKKGSSHETSLIFGVCYLVKSLPLDIELNEKHVDAPQESADSSERWYADLGNGIEWHLLPR